MQKKRQKQTRKKIYSTVFPKDHMRRLVMEIYKEPVQTLATNSATDSYQQGPSMRNLMAAGRIRQVPNGDGTFRIEPAEVHLVKV